MEDAHQAWLEARDCILEDLECLLNWMDNYNKAKISMVVTKQNIRVIERALRFIKYAKD